MFKCSIERINNGFILREVCEDNKENGKVIVFEDGPITVDRVYSTNAFEEEIVPLQKVFYSVMEFFGVYNSKHERKALDISIVDRDYFPVEDSLEELTKLRAENEKLNMEKVLLEQKYQHQQYKITENTPILDMEKDLKEGIASGVFTKDKEK